MNKRNYLLLSILVILATIAGNVLAEHTPLRVGWAGGHLVDHRGDTIGPSILHTRNKGRKWVEQADAYRWPGYRVTDVSAVDKLTAWASLSGDVGARGVILHTRNGGVKWVEQTVPEGVAGGIKQIKGLSRSEAWAASIQGSIVHTTDGGQTWSIVEHPSIPITQVNRMDVIGCVDPKDATRPGKNKLVSNANIWIADDQGGKWGMVHSLYNGELWRQEYVPYTLASTGIHMLDAYSPRIAWTVAWFDGMIFRTLDGGETWELAAEVGPNDIDDMCSPSPDTLWAVQYQNTVGFIHHVRVFDVGEPEVRSFNPFDGYLYEGMTCVDDQTALVVGLKASSSDPLLPDGLIISTSDGGQNWIRHSIPDNVVLWKTSFVGAQR